jgi:hypothetical protein
MSFTGPRPGFLTCEGSAEIRDIQDLVDHDLAYLGSHGRRDGVHRWTVPAPRCALPKKRKAPRRRAVGLEGGM